LSKLTNGRNELNEESGNDTYSFIAVRLPYGVQFDEDDCQDALNFIQPTKIYTLILKMQSMPANAPSACTFLILPKAMKKQERE
jgi:hypothetical protein